MVKVWVARAKKASQSAARSIILAKHARPIAAAETLRRALRWLKGLLLLGSNLARLLAVDGILMETNKEEAAF